MATNSTTPSPCANQAEQLSSPSIQHDSSFLSTNSAENDHDTSLSSIATNGEDRHPKGKRKRTQAQDKLILEEAYQSNPKPDKQARLEIVGRVSLNEKEVQIWFQNRRQNDRRKSRPLSPQEIAALRYGSLPGIGPDSVHIGLENGWSDLTVSRDQDDSFPPTSLPHQMQENDDDNHHVSAGAGKENLEPGRSLAESPSGSQESQSQSHSQSFGKPVGYLANRWNLGSSFASLSKAKLVGGAASQKPGLPSSSAESDQARSKSRSASNVRLSLSLEGKAELVSNKASPEKPVLVRSSSSHMALPLPQIQNPKRLLQRSQSALPMITLPPISALTGHLPPRLSRGRSRDVHAWESCADAEARDELINQAENESNGSAVAAITLLRSASGSQPSTARRAGTRSSPKPGKGSHPAKKAKFNRASSTSELDKEQEKDRWNGKVKVSMLVSPTDSDKENWSPDEDGNPLPHAPRPRTLPGNKNAGYAAKSQNPRRLGRVLQEAKGAAFLHPNARSKTAPAGPKENEGIEIFEDGEVSETTASAKRKRTREDEVEKFMRGEVSPSKRGDMDCVAGLLSLSQGAWR